MTTYRTDPVQIVTDHRADAVEAYGDDAGGINLYAYSNGEVVWSCHYYGDEDEADMAVELQSMAEAFAWELGALLTLTGCKTPWELGFKYSVTYGWIPSAWRE